ncbi:hypothetical protein E2C01_034401 [Portunus trituberculatus]|uniref:Uncharacterized protein n=1 Tax=Portunus trituberculatus TaxID=210409 RepID=A0A5B7F2R9_PORTR|nr:hypothetical protein [Portunus trituberculatus]
MPGAAQPPGLSSSPQQVGCVVLMHIVFISQIMKMSHVFPHHLKLPQNSCLAGCPEEENSTASNTYCVGGVGCCCEYGCCGVARDIRNVSTLHQSSCPAQPSLLELHLLLPRERQAGCLPPSKPQPPLWVEAK